MKKLLSSLLLSLVLVGFVAAETDYVAMPHIRDHERRIDDLESGSNVSNALGDFDIAGDLDVQGSIYCTNNYQVIYFKSTNWAEVEGNLEVDSADGSFRVGYSDSYGWEWSTMGGGADLQLKYTTNRKAGGVVAVYYDRDGDISFRNRRVVTSNGFHAVTGSGSTAWDDAVVGSSGQYSILAANQTSYVYAVECGTATVKVPQNFSRPFASDPFVTCTWGVNPTGYALFVSSYNMTNFTADVSSGGPTNGWFFWIAMGPRE